MARKIMRLTTATGITTTKAALSPAFCRSRCLAGSSRRPQHQYVSLAFCDKEALKNVSFSVKGGTKTAVIDPTAAGKTRLLYVLIGLLQPTSGTVTYDGEPLGAYDKEALHGQVGFVFQDSILFNMSLRENIAFSSEIPDEDLEQAIAAAELRDFIGTLPQGLDTVVSERGTTCRNGNVSSCCGEGPRSCG